MKHIIDIETWERRDNYNFFRNFHNSWISITSEVDCTEAFPAAKAAKRSFFLYYLYAVLRAANEVKEFRFRTDKPLQRAHPEQSGMGIRRGVRGLRDIRDRDGQARRILKDARRLRGGQDQHHPDEIHQPLRKEHGRPSGDGQAFEVPRHRGAVREGTHQFAFRGWGADALAPGVLCTGGEPEHLGKREVGSQAAVPVRRDRDGEQAHPRIPV